MSTSNTMNIEFKNDKMLRILKITALVTASIAAIAITLMIALLYRIQNAYENNRTNSRIQFIVDRDSNLTSISHMRIYINGVEQNEHLRADSSGKLSFGIQSEVGLRPKGAITSIIKKINSDAVELRVNYAEGVNSEAQFLIKPEIQDCDSICAAKFGLRQSIDSLKRQIIILQRKVNLDES